MSRTKSKIVVFLLLLVLTVAFLSLGVILWRACNNNMKEYDKIFHTIGVVNQKENAVKVEEHWDAAFDEYTYWDEPIYDSITPLSVLEFEGAGYIENPEQRSYYGAYSPNINIWPTELEEGLIRSWGTILEFIPYEDGIPSKPVKVKVTKVHWGTIRREGEDIWFCDQFNDNPGLLKKGRTYIASTQSWGIQFEGKEYRSMGYAVPLNILKSTQKDIYGEIIPQKNVSTENWAEVTDHFFDTEEGKRWEELIGSYDRFIKNTIPVIPTNKTELLLDFYQGNTPIAKGRDITKNEYEAGAKVCIIPQELANRNNLKIGNKLNLQLYFADYEKSSSQTYYPTGSLVMDFGLLNSEGEAYSVFENGDYEIVGIYNNTQQTNNPTGYEIGYNAVVIPSNSVENSDKNNIINFGPMKGYTTSFEIPNGTTKQYMEEFQKLGINNLEINFYDGGYEKLAAGMKNLKMIAMILIVVSIVTTMAILLFFIFLFIGKQKKRTAIERSLGMNKKECTRSLLYGILGIVSIGSLVGSITGFMISDRFMTNAMDLGEELYSTSFSNWVNSTDKIIELASTQGGMSSLFISIVICTLVVLLAAIISLLFIMNNLKIEPLELLSKTEE
jgi:ABC-type antimicrobial peptide transport system permease subunit